jgi:hypothetical protein
MIKQFDWNFLTNKELFSDLKVTELLDNKKLMTKMFRYDLEFNEDTHWKLVQLGALKKMHQEDFVEELITCVIEVLSMDEEEEEEEEKEKEVNHIGDINKMVPPPVGGLVERVKLAIDSALYDEDEHQWVEARAAILEVARWLRAQGLIINADLLEQEAGR